MVLNWYEGISRVWNEWGDEQPMTPADLRLRLRRDLGLSVESNPTDSGEA